MKKGDLCLHQHSVVLDLRRQSWIFPKKCILTRILNLDSQVYGLELVHGVFAMYGISSKHKRNDLEMNNWNLVLKLGGFLNYTVYEKYKSKSEKCIKNEELKSD